MSKLIATTAAVLLAGTALAAAQGMNTKSEGAAPAPSAQSSAPAPAQAQPAQTTGQAQREPSGGTAAGEDKRPNKAATDTKASTDVKADQKSSMDKSKADSKSAADNKAGADKSKMDNKAAADSKAGDQKSAQDSKTTTKTTTTTGQGAAGAHGKANLSTDQRTKIRTVITEKVKVQPLTNVNFSVNVGTRIPRTVHYYPLPAEVVSIYPEWRGYSFVMVGNQIVIIEPSTYEIVEIIS